MSPEQQQAFMVSDPVRERIEPYLPEKILAAAYPTESVA